ncbi:E3 ubiquitin-protein ligase MARCHF7 isoform X2 [Pelodiscus sinensis]|uniref:E3 ubiquitin-protein ligase MARCHF7 isoform X2 n=1 Tax=Pelodiscus sinensis TaxID=13735 RepID=UPI0003C474E6|nr:E3 ubiquitin-protein ligase MARCH7 isoform X2 [Pelodiscus sinensis]|eukprot:XP_006111715.1 E3 ubiquitin-protein ligase MARCH7 isoform X2 [Pelodiscus sinensis]
MESKPSRIPRRISVQPSSSSSSARTMDGSRGSSLTDTYHTRDSSLRLDAGCQESNLFHNSSRDWGIGERGETHEVPWKLNSSSPTRYSGTIDHPWSGRFLGSRSRLSASSSSSPFSSTWYGESENTQGAYSRLHNQQRDSDSKRPKLSYTSTSSVRSNGLNTVSDSSWRYNQVPRSSSMVLSSLGTEIVRERRELERRTDPSVSSLVDYSHRNGDFTSSAYLNRPASSYAQGARPKDNSLSTLRLNTSMNHQLPSEHETSLFSRVSSRSSSRSNYSAREMEPSQRNIQPEFTHIAIRDEMPSPSNTERVLSQRSLSEPPADTEGRRTTRQLLSRLASSMSSTFFSRRSSQDSLNTRSDSEDSCVVPRVQTATQSSTNATARHEVPGIQTPEASQGFSFLRRRWGLSGVSQNHSSDSDVESYRQESESRNTGSWLSSSLRNRCTPLFSRRRREGRDESARTSTSDTPGRSLHLFRRRESSEETQLEAQSSSSGAAASTPVPAVSSSPTTTASTPDSAHSIRNSGVSGILPGSLFRLAVPPSLGSSLSDNVMITVDIIPSSWNQPDAEEIDKSKILPSRDPERLQKIKESLLLEDTEEEEGDLCRICQMSSTSPTNLLIEPCKCTGSLQYVHQECMKKWLQSKINSGSSLEAVTTCELCKEKLHLNLEDFDIHELYRAHANEQADYEFISSGLYLVVLLHLCEQRFSDMLGTASEASTRVRFINLARTLQAHMEDIESSCVLFVVQMNFGMSLISPGV